MTNTLRQPCRCHLAVSAFFFLLGLCFATWASRIPDVRASLGLNDAQLGTALFAAPLGQVPAMFLAGWLVERFGSRVVLIGGLVLYVGAIAAIGFATSLWGLFLCLFFFGLGCNFFDNAVNTQAVGLEALRKRSFMGFFHGLWSLGGVTGGVLGAFVATEGVGVREHFVGVALASLVVLALFLRWTLARDIRPSTAPATGRGFALPDGYLVLLGAISFGTMAVEGTMYDWSAIYFTSVVAAPQEYVRTGYIVCMVAMVAGRFVMDGFVSRLGYIRVLRLSACSIAVGFGLLVGVPQLVPATVGAALVGFGMAAAVPICFSLAGRSTRMPPSAAIALVTGISFCGFLLGPPVIGHLAHAFSLRAAFALVGLLGASSLVIAPLLRRYLEK